MQKDFAQPTAASTIASVLCRRLEEKRYPWKPLLRQSGIEYAQLLEPDARIPVDRLADLFAHAQSSTPGLDISQFAATGMRLDDLHALGIVMRFSDTLFDACRTLATHFHWLIDGLRLSVSHRAPQVLIELHGPELQLRGSVLLDWLMYSLAQLVAQVGNTPILPQNLEIKAFRHGRSNGDWSLESPANHNRLVYSDHHFFHPLPQRDRELCQHNLQLIQNRLANNSELQMALHARNTMEQLLLRRQLNEQQLAQHLRISVRTLQRRLKQANTCYSTLLMEVRKSLAAELLRKSQLPIEQIAQRLGFTEPANFSRAFRRWYGVTPSAYRHQFALSGNHLPAPFSTLSMTTQAVY